MRKGWLDTWVDGLGEEWEATNAGGGDTIPCYVFTEEEMEAALMRMAEALFDAETPGTGGWGAAGRCEDPECGCMEIVDEYYLRARSIVMGEEHG